MLLFLFNMPWPGEVIKSSVFSFFFFFPCFFFSLGNTWSNVLRTAFLFPQATRAEQTNVKFDPCTTHTQRHGGILNLLFFFSFQRMIIQEDNNNNKKAARTHACM